MITQAGEGLRWRLANREQVEHGDQRGEDPPSQGYGGEASPPSQGYGEASPPRQGYGEASPGFARGFAEASEQIFYFHNLMAAYWRDSWFSCHSVPKRREQKVTTIREFP